MLANYKRDAKSNKAGSLYKPAKYDLCQTPGYAFEPLVPFLNPDWLIWEPARGEGILEQAIAAKGFRVIGSDILTNENFFEYRPLTFDCIVTNPPFSIKYQWLDRCYQLDTPFALLMPLEMLGTKTAQRLFKRHGLELILMNRRVDFKMPHKGWRGKGAQFPVAWYTYGLNIGKELIYTELIKQ